MPPSQFTMDVIDAISAIPHGRVATYGGLAALVGSPRAARQGVQVSDRGVVNLAIYLWDGLNGIGKQ